MATKPMISVKLPGLLKKKKTHWVSFCPVLDVFSQGSTEEEAKANLEEAVKLFLISCYERGTLEEVLKECGFKLADKKKKMSEKKDPSFFEVPIELLASSRCA